MPQKRRGRAVSRPNLTRRLEAKTQRLGKPSMSKTRPPKRNVPRPLAKSQKQQQKIRIRRINLRMPHRYPRRKRPAKT